MRNHHRPAMSASNNSIHPIPSSSSSALPTTIPIPVPPILRAINVPAAAPTTTSIPPVELKERREATDCANSEFNRVKRAKLENERLKYRRSNAALDEKAEKQLDRERANRASAAASRAKIVCYARELEKRTDRLERERNSYALSSEKAIKKLRSFREESKKLKGVLRKLWELKDPKTCSYLVDSNALFLLANKDKDDDTDITDNEVDIINNTANTSTTSITTNDHPVVAAADNTNTTKKLQQHLPPIGAAVTASDRTNNHHHHHHHTTTQLQMQAQPPYYAPVLPPPTNTTNTTTSVGFAQRSSSPAQPLHPRAQYPPQQQQHQYAPHPPPRLVPLGQIASHHPNNTALLGPLPGVPNNIPATSGAIVYSTAPPYPAYAYNTQQNTNSSGYVLAPPIPRESPWRNNNNTNNTNTNNNTATTSTATPYYPNNNNSNNNSKYNNIRNSVADTQTKE